MVFMLCVQGSLSIALNTFAMASQFSSFALTNFVAGGAGGAFTANEYILLGAVPSASGSNVVTATFNSAPGTGSLQPILWYIECIPNFSNAGSYFVDQNGSSPFQSYNNVTGSNIILFNPAGQYPADGEFFVFHEQCSAAASGVSGSGYSEAHTAVAPLGQTIWDPNYSAGVGAATANLSATGFVMGLGCVFKYQFADIPECIPAMGVM
jgi:hypothetical protein